MRCICKLFNKNEEDIPEFVDDEIPLIGVVVTPLVFEFVVEDLNTSGMFTIEFKPNVDIRECKSIAVVKSHILSKKIK